LSSRCLADEFSGHFFRVAAAELKAPATWRQSGRGFSAKEIRRQRVRAPGRERATYQTTPSSMYGGNGWLAATAGTLASISDGPAANSGDAACTTFGTTVTGGGGALKLLLWRNGTAWTLRGLLTNSNRKAARSHPLALRKPCAQLLVFR
jgi:hypothetical protein